MASVSSWWQSGSDTSAGQPDTNSSETSRLRARRRHTLAASRTCSMQGRRGGPGSRDWDGRGGEGRGRQGAREGWLLRGTPET
eukprot:214880-Chlamydomonas_euryale.AAC.1